MAVVVSDITPSTALQKRSEGQECNRGEAGRELYGEGFRGMGFGFGFCVVVGLALGN